MSQAASPSDPHDRERSTGESTPAGRRRGRKLIPGVVVAVILGIFAVLLLITRCGSGSDDVSQDGASSTAVVADIAPSGKDA